MSELLGLMALSVMKMGISLGEELDEPLGGCKLGDIGSLGELLILPLGEQLALSTR
jgi:hypothetical protein